MGHCAAFFYANDGLIVLTDLVWLQGAFYTLARFFYRAGLWTNVRKTDRMICRPCHVEGTYLEVFDES